MKRIILLFLIVLLLAGCSRKEVFFTDQGIEELNNSFNGQIIEKEVSIEDAPPMYDIVYHADEQTYRNYFRPELRSALDWIVNNTPKNSVFLNWWDYGHMIRGYTGRSVIVFSPSEDLLWTLASGEWDEESSGPFATDEDTQDVSFALFGDDIEATRLIMEKHGAYYIFVTSIDKDIFEYTLFYKMYSEEEFSEDEKTQKIEEAIITKLLNGEAFEGFNVAYADQYVKIYQRIY
ncbi:MAG: lipoprotein [archaeon]